MDCVETAKQVMNEFRKITPKPVMAIIYAYYHQDHTLGSADVWCRDGNSRGLEALF